MKPVRFIFCALIGALFLSSSALAQTSLKAELQQMSNAVRTLNYEISFVNITRQGLESMRYRHARLNNHSLAQLVYMDGPQREIVQRGDEVSYFDAGLEPFSMSSGHIVDSLPSLVYADFQRLSEYYNFIPAVTRVRIADRLCEGVRLVSRDNTRYGYTVWFDVASKLPLRVDLQDLDGDRLEQFLATSLIVDDGILKAMKPLENIALPPQVAPPAAVSADFSWKAEWLPLGIREVSRGRRTLPGVNVPIESRLYSDGLFSFSINVSASTEPRVEQYLRTGRRTVHTEIRDNYEITVVGELPPATAKRIAGNVITGTQQ